MPLRMAITKASGQGEQLVVDVCQWNPVTGDLLHTVDEMSELFEQALAFADVRLQEMNLRHLEAYDLEKYFDVQIWQRVMAILDILAGRQTAQTVAQRWHSEVEETQALADCRQQHYNEHLVNALNNGEGN